MLLAGTVGTLAERFLLRRRVDYVLNAPTLLGEASSKLIVAHGTMVRLVAGTSIGNLGVPAKGGIAPPRPSPRRHLPSKRKSRATESLLIRKLPYRHAGDMRGSPGVAGTRVDHAVGLRVANTLANHLKTPTVTRRWAHAPNSQSAVLEE